MGAPPRGTLTSTPDPLRQRVRPSASAACWAAIRALPREFLREGLDNGTSAYRETRELVRLKEPIGMHRGELEDHLGAPWIVESTPELLVSLLQEPGDI